MVTEATGKAGTARERGENAEGQGEAKGTNARLAEPAEKGRKIQYWNESRIRTHVREAGFCPPWF